MWWISIVTRRLREGKTYDDFRRAWFHTVGFGTTARLYTAVSVADPREIIVVAIGEVRPGQDPMALLRTDVKERTEHPLDAVIEPEIGRNFGVLVAEDDFSHPGQIPYRAAFVDGRPTDFAEVDQALSVGRTLIAKAAEERDRARKGGGSR
ncbi:MAG TPA: ROK family protein [Thermoplasmata archaeon]|nr:ROK family protein [Thermoplasmata archaeon]